MTNDIDLPSIATGRPTSMLDRDWRDLQPRLTEALTDARVLVIGGAGSIGSSVVKLLALFRTAALHIVDHNENSLVEIVRDLRGGQQQPRCADLRLLPLEFGSPLMESFLTDESPYDFVLNFAAVKHVRSEKDIYSALHMLNTNVLKQAELLRWLARKGTALRYFSVSTDKAANPANLMGASKRLMEHVMFGRAHASPFRTTCSARFANVAFSDGSLLQGWHQRLAKRQPIAVPTDAQRYFVTIEEAGQLCLLSAVALGDSQIAVPNLDPASDLKLLKEIAATFIRFHGYEPREFSDPGEAIDSLPAETARGRYPLLLTPLNTAGEKHFEVFIGKTERAHAFGLAGLSAISYEPERHSIVIDPFLEMLRRCATNGARIGMTELLGAVAALIPEFEYAASSEKLDERL